MPRQAPYVLPDDRPYVDAWNKIALGERRHERVLQTQQLPVPYAGDLDNATVVMLLRNPGYDATDTRRHQRLEVRQASRSNLLQRRRAWPFPQLAPTVAATPGGRYWRRALRLVLDEVDAKLVASRFAMIEYHGYHSRNWAALPITLPSQHYSFDLVRGAMERQAWIIVSRGARDWDVAVPGLADYAYKVRLNSARSASLSPLNCPGRSFNAIIDALKK